MKTVKLILLGCTAMTFVGGAALAQEACKTYTVQAGDNLRFIARAAYGNANLYRVIYDANTTVIGEKVDLIEIGMQLAIPCNSDGSPDPVSTELATEVIDPATQPVEPVAELPVAAVAEPAPEAVAETAAAPIPIRMVTGNGYAPFADETLDGGGMFTQLVEMAIFRADPAITYNMTFVNDWQAHIDALLPSQAYDLSFPWVKPDCDGGTPLSAGDQMRCDQFVFSAPFYEIVDGFFATNDSPLVSVTTYDAFEGKRICRPEGFTIGVLEAAGLTAPRVELMRPVSATDCFEALAAGKVDLVSIDAEVGDSAIAELGLTGKFTQNPHLMALQSLHVIAHKSNPRATEMLGMLNDGVVEMYESGEWYDIVSSALTANLPKQ